MRTKHTGKSCVGLWGQSSISISGRGVTVCIFVTITRLYDLMFVLENHTYVICAVLESLLICAVLNMFEILNHVHHFESV